MESTKEISNFSSEGFLVTRAKAEITHRRPYDYDEKTKLFKYRLVGEIDTVYNVKTNIGRIFIHKQYFGTSGLGTNGFNYIALSNDTVTETATSTVLSSEITTNGLSRAQGTVILASGVETTSTITKVFTATGTQSAKKAALFDLSSGGNINHIVAFAVQRDLYEDDEIEIRYTIGIS